jgi:CheY-like chemotaxis protein
MAEIPALPPQRVLVVDDYPDTAETTAMLLRLWGHDARIALDGPTALSLATHYAPQVVLLDLGLPGMDGFEVVRRLRQTPTLREALVVSLSGHGLNADFQRALAAGCNCHLVKPVEPDLLRQLLANYFKSSASAPAPPARNGS